MLAILSLVSGFVSPWIGDMFGMFKAKQQNAHELAMLVESNKSAREIAELNAQVGMAQAEVDDVRSARAAQPSYGVALLDAIRGDKGWITTYFMRPILLVALTVIEIANGLMRPYAIYLILTLWASTKAARFYFAYTATSGGANAEDVLYAVASASLAVWDEHDWVALDYAL